MEGNPYTEFISKLREDTSNRIPTVHRFGTVRGINPLRVEVGETIQERLNLLKDQKITSFEVGDTLLLVPIEDEQRFIIICKVVGA